MPSDIDAVFTLVYKTIRLDPGADSPTTMMAHIYREADKEGGKTSLERGLFY
jgi:hypothetical protein